MALLNLIWLINVYPPKNFIIDSLSLIQISGYFTRFK